MFFAAIAIVLLLAAVIAAALPLLLGIRGRSDDSAASGETVYRDQLRELERERAEGLIEADTYEAARAEVGRRLLAAGSDKHDGKQKSDASRSKWSLVIAVAAVFVCAGLAYPYFGSPGMSDQPLAARLSADQPELSVLVARVEQHLASNPDDARGWDVIAPVYFRQGRFGEAREAYANAIRLTGPSPDRLVGLGEAMVRQSSGIVADEALEVFRQAAAGDGGDDRASFFVALAAEQSGDNADALRQFSQLAARFPEGAPMRDLINQHISANRNAVANAGVVGNGPDQQTIDAAASLSESERGDMVRGMVSGLADRLAANPDDIDGWMQLVRSYAVLGDKAAAGEAVDRATAFFGEGSEPADRLAALASALQLEATSP
ncbi:c-type cytochrome biogenesis protein CcmI [Martelella endophytica]|uniref:Cytochrome c-type biogenesis protein H TPR domain-containing protein n=1 Tax=Martelella endophytica TaxID=1486262 RepID=A0A0D5LT02_MAREN|nr:c-type cytochrome biogenesis protein CcmI [Martelella endophytica]AJY47221.1 hypothetical protein TM49_18530 [Martelella endophytica]